MSKIKEIDPYIQLSQALAKAKQAAEPKISGEPVEPEVYIPSDDPIDPISKLVDAHDVVIKSTISKKLQNAALERRICDLPPEFLVLFGIVDPFSVLPLGEYLKEHPGSMSPTEEETLANNIAKESVRAGKPYKLIG